MAADIVLEYLDAQRAPALVDRFVALYLEVYPDGGFHGEERYRRQLTGHLTAPGWQAVTASRGGAGCADLAGYAYGFALGPQTRWWNGLLTEVPADFRVEDGQRTFAVSELLVCPKSRRRGVGRALHAALLSARGERRATLLVEPENLVAQTAYASWGWRKVASLRPSWPGAPVFDVLILPLCTPVAGTA
jgi:GNAT superfamily N-acetyltransferase